MGWPELADAALVATRGTLGEPADFTPASTGVPEPIIGIFQRPSLELDAEGVPFRSTGPVLGVRLADLSVPPIQGDMVEVRSLTYEIRDIDTDGQGGAKLILHLLQGN